MSEKVKGKREEVRGEGRAKSVNRATTRINLSKPVTTYAVDEVLRDNLPYHAVITEIEVKWHLVGNDDFEKIFRNR